MAAAGFPDREAQGKTCGTPTGNEAYPFFCDTKSFILNSSGERVFDNCTIPSMSFPSDGTPGKAYDGNLKCDSTSTMAILTEDNKIQVHNSLCNGATNIGDQPFVCCPNGMVKTDAMGVLVCMVKPGLWEGPKNIPW